jgi:hypothetical protein
VTFREGLLKARGQITFVAALAISTGIIIHLEALDTEERIQARVAAEISRQKENAAAAPQPLRAAVGVALRQAEEAYARDPAANRALLLTSVSGAARLGVMETSEGLARIGKALDSIEQNPGERSAALVSALGVAAAAFPTLQDRIARLSSAP